MVDFDNLDSDFDFDLDFDYFDYDSDRRDVQLRGAKVLGTECG